MSQSENGHHFRWATPQEAEAALQAHFNRPNDPGHDSISPIEPFEAQRHRKQAEHQALIENGYKLEVIMTPNGNNSDMPVITYFKEPISLVEIKTDFQP